MRLLLAEDEKELNTALSTVLRRNNYTVDCAYDGEEALDFIDSNEYDGVILDIMMPKIDGIKVLKTMRNLYIICRKSHYSLSDQRFGKIFGVKINEILGAFA